MTLENRCGKRQGEGYTALHAIWEGMIIKFTSCFESWLNGAMEAGWALGRTGTAERLSTTPHPPGLCAQASPVLLQLQFLPNSCFLQPITHSIYCKASSPTLSPSLVWSLTFCWGRNRWDKRRGRRGKLWEKQESTPKMQLNILNKDTSLQEKAATEIISTLPCCLLLLTMIYENIQARERSVHGGRSSAQSASQNGTVRKLPSCSCFTFASEKSFQIELLEFSQHLILTVSSRRE